MKVLLTGGHFSPAFAVIQELQKRGDEVVIVGRKHAQEGDKSISYEYSVSKELRVPFHELKTGRLQRKVTLHTVPSLIRFFKGIVQATTILKQEKPDVILTFGGYIALPVAIVAYLKKIPIITHEQTQGLGLSNKIIAKMARTLCISFPETKRYVSHSRTVLTGNPIRKNIFMQDKTFPIPQNMPVIYITGGSTGSHLLNTVVKEAAASLLEKYVLIHQTGDNMFGDYESVQRLKDELPQELQERYIVKKFVYPDEIGFVYKSADLVIGRSGVNTVLELLALNKPSLLIPLSHGQKGEQLQNAELLKKLGLAEVILQYDFTAETLREGIENMMEDIAKYRVDKDIIDQYIVRDAPKRIVQELAAQYEKKKTEQE